MYNVVKNTKTLTKITQFKDEIGHSCNLVEKKIKLHPNYKSSCVGNHL
jgi:hypothetical protein